MISAGMPFWAGVPSSPVLVVALPVMYCCLAQISELAAAAAVPPPLLRAAAAAPLLLPLPCVGAA